MWKVPGATYTMPGGLVGIHLLSGDTPCNIPSLGAALPFLFFPPRRLQLLSPDKTATTAIRLKNLLIIFCTLWVLANVMIIFIQKFKQIPSVCFFYAKIEPVFFKRVNYSNIVNENVKKKLFGWILCITWCYLQVFYRKNFGKHIVKPLFWTLYFSTMDIFFPHLKIR